MAALRLFVILALAGCLASAARLPDVQLIESELPESAVAFQGADLHPQSTEESGLDLGESPPTGGTWNCRCSPGPRSIPVVYASAL